MKNFIQEGDTLTVPAPTGGAVSGSPVIIGSLIGIAGSSAAESDPVAVKTKGVFELPKVSALAIGIGDPVYWDGTAKNVTKTSTSNTLIGYATEAAANPSPTVRVRIG
jgi:predicted RecA/RadA family phage recombinase